HRFPPPPPSFLLFTSLLPPPPRSTLFPYTTLFRSRRHPRARPRRDLHDAHRGRRRHRHPAHHLRQAREHLLLPDRHLAGLRLLRSEEHTSELQSRSDLVCRLLLEKKKKHKQQNYTT